MAVQLYMDVHVPQAITDQLRRRNVDVPTAREDNADELPDDKLLERVSNQNEWLNTIEFLPL